MKTTSFRARDRRSFRLEFLEDRNLLSVIKPPAIHAEATRFFRTPATFTAFSGNVIGLPAPAPLYTYTPAGYTGFSGHGRATHIGTVYLGAQHVETRDTATNPATLAITDGQAILTAANGDELTVTYTGSGTFNRRGVSTDTLFGVVTGGTGRFVYASGTFSAIATGLDGRGKFHINFNVNLNSPA